MLFTRYARAALIWALIFSLPLPTIARSSGAEIDPGTAHVLRRLNSPEQASAMADAARQDAAAQAAYPASDEKSAAVAPSPPKQGQGSAAPLRGAGAAPLPAGGNTEQSSRPKTVTEVLFNGVTGFMGLPGLTASGGSVPQRGPGVGLPQDGTARRADGGMHDNLWGRDDSTRGERRTDGGAFGNGMFDNPQNYFVQRGLNYGMGLMNSAGEAALSGLVDGGRARLNFMIDLDGRVNGEGDVLLPFYDSQYTTIYTQLGARSMSGMNRGGSDGKGASRWIGNAGLGQRWFPQAQSVTDSGNWMLGYNAFFDYDFTRSHQRGGVGIEVQHDWLRLASNYYFPISSWRDSKDFDGDFVKERAAEGWDIRAKGYLPFYRNLAVTGAYTQWYGDHVGMFSSSKLEKDPKVWSYGLEYTPVPLVSGFVNRRSTENGRSDTEFGLRFTYHFEMPWEDQISHSKVTKLRTVSGSRHEFVDRENRIILEYKAKNSYRIEYLGSDSNGFRFRVVNGFGKYMAGQTVRVTAGGAYLAEAAPAGPQTLFAKALNFLDELISIKAAYAAGFASKTYVTDSQGYFWIQLDPSAPLLSTVTVSAGDNSRTFTLTGSGASSSITFTVTNGPNFTGAKSSTASIVATFKDAGGNPLPDGTTVTWSVTAANNHSPAMAAGWGARSTGLAWGASPVDNSLFNNMRVDLTASVTTQISGGSGQTTVQLTDVVGERTITVQATATGIGSTAQVSFGNGPLSVFAAPPTATTHKFSEQSPPITALTTSFPVADYCGGSITYSGDGYYSSSNIPTLEQFKKISSSQSGDRGGNGAWGAAGWSDTPSIWTDEIKDSGQHITAVNWSATAISSNIDQGRPIVCLR